MILALTASVGALALNQGAPAAAPVLDPGGWDLAAWAFALACIGLLPFLFAVLTSFGKLVIVGGILRRALGTPEIPPNSVLAGLAILLTMHIMSPVAIETHRAYTANEAAPGAPSDPAPADPSAGDVMQGIIAAGEAPLAGFLERHSNPANVQLFQTLRARLIAGQQGGAVPPTGVPPTGAPANEAAATLVGSARFEMLTVLAPAFLLTELAEAFMLGFLLFIPFLVIDLAVSNVLLALGMHMLAPAYISLPLKLLLFVLIDGWRLLLQGLVLGYA